MPSCGQLVQYLRIVRGKICERSSTPPHTPALSQPNPVDIILGLPNIIPAFLPDSTHKSITYSSEVTAHFSPLSTSPITTHHKKEIKKGL